MHRVELLNEQRFSCPYCGANIVLLINAEDAGADFIEDCQVCCQPIRCLVSFDQNDEMVLTVMTGDEA